MLNVFIKNNSEINDNWIYYFILCKIGIYLFEMKEWEEKLIYGLMKENVGIYLFMIDEMGKY